MFSIDKKSALILALEGMASASVQFLVLRQTVPFVGSSVLTASIIITLFLAALALGYQTGGKVAQHHQARFQRNILASVGLLGIGLSYPVVSIIFDGLSYATLGVPYLNNPLFHLAIYCCISMVPLVYLLAQTIPLMINNSASKRAAEAAGNATALSTWGNVVGGLLTTLILMYYLGVGWSIVLNCLVLLACLGLSLHNSGNARLYHLIAAVGVCLVAVRLNVTFENDVFVATTVYGNYSVYDNPQLDGNQLVINRSNASFVSHLDRHGWPYVEIIKRHIARTETQGGILVLGAGGFSLTADRRDDLDITYVDIDPSIKRIAEEFFLEGNSQGTFIAQDARYYLKTTDQVWDVIVIDVYSNLAVIPWHLTTAEFYELVARRLTSTGMAILNVAGNPYLADDFTRNIDATIRSTLDRCITDITTYRDDKESLVYICHKPSRHYATRVYHDDNTRATIDSYLASIRTQEIHDEKKPPHQD